MTRLPLPALLVLPPPPAALESKRRSLSCRECSRPVGAGRVRHPACLTAAVRRKEGAAR
ncbi:hypothetical protein GCM10023224_05330 [Streptomonospora halophila]|uniref:Uncharacterized protein n=1 Tax=Streptomonospora halophila TaxID=427369 RepID=A0ABP9GBZ1_9ACTN